jgi:hypothetical protein
LIPAAPSCLPLVDLILRFAQGGEERRFSFAIIVKPV